MPLCLSEGDLWRRILEPNKWPRGIKFPFFSNEIVNTVANTVPLIHIICVRIEESLVVHPVV